MKLLINLATGLFVAAACVPVMAQESSERRALFGETHIHTVWSFDAYMFSTRATPDDAYAFAKGKALKHPLGQTYQLKRPLDFMAVTDHAFYMGSMAKMSDPDHPLFQHPLAKIVNDPNPDVRGTAFGLLRARNIAGKPFTVRELINPEIQQEAWDRTIASANRHNDPGNFTALIGYEYTAGDQGNNLHRNVIFRGDTAPIPFSRIDSGNPEDLWAWMDKIRAEGHEALAIPHNSNMSDGLMFEREKFDDTPLTAEYAELRNRNEPLVEVTQVKGTSEAHPMLSPNDEFADFELYEKNHSRKQITHFAGSYVRDAYRTGLEFQETEGFNPYRFGLIGASDSHTCIVPVIESDFSGKAGTTDGTPAKRLQRLPRWSASGLAAVWAEENTRGSIYDAFRRKETWATTGPRIRVRFFGGLGGLDGVDPSATDWVSAAYANGVPMGGSLGGNAGASSPEFIVWAVKDSDSANLDRIQIVKCWSEGGKSQERVFDVVWSGDRQTDPATGKLPAVGNTVDEASLEYTNAIGAVELASKWTDPDFDPKLNAFYYVRVLEIPTPRWSAFDAKALGIAHPKDLPMTIQERAYTSPIWYDAR